MFDVNFQRIERGFRRRLVGVKERERDALGEKGIFFQLFSFFFWQGRKFYKCGKPQGQGCNFFLWADDESAPVGTHHQDRIPETRPRRGENFAAPSQPRAEFPPSNNFPGESSPSVPSMCVPPQP